MFHSWYQVRVCVYWMYHPKNCCNESRMFESLCKKRGTLRKLLRYIIHFGFSRAKAGPSPSRGILFGLISPPPAGPAVQPGTSTMCTQNTKLNLAKQQRWQPLATQYSGLYFYFRLQRCVNRSLH